MLWSRLVVVETSNSSTAQLLLCTCAQRGMILRQAMRIFRLKHSACRQCAGACSRFLPRPHLSRYTGHEYVIVRLQSNAAAATRTLPLHNILMMTCSSQEEDEGVHSGSSSQIKVVTVSSVACVFTLTRWTDHVGWHSLKQQVQ